MEDLSQRKPPQLNIRAEDTSPEGENGALVWSTTEGRLLTYNENAGRWGVVGVYPALSSVMIPGVVYNSFVDLIGISTMGVAANHQYFVPFYLTEDRVVNSLAFEITTAATSGVAYLGIYNTQVMSGNSMPYQLLTSTDSMSITSVGIKTAATSPSVTLRAGLLYWASMLATVFVAIRGCVPPSRWILASFQSPPVALRIPNNSSALVNTAPTTGYTGTFPAPIIAYQ
jgi:hypothetical protein